MLEDDDIAVARLLADKVNSPVRCGEDPGSCRGGKVDTLVLDPLVVHRMVAPAEARRQARELDRRAEKRARHAPSVEGVVDTGVAAICAVIPQGLVELGAVDEFDGHDATVAHQRTVTEARLIDNAKAIALDDVVLEIDHAREDRNHLPDDVVGHIRCVHRPEEPARRDSAGTHLVTQFVPDRLQVRVKGGLLEAAGSPDQQFARGSGIAGNRGAQRD
ncbi:hypothetical protein D9M72_537310 [compost metagenome]